VLLDRPKPTAGYSANGRRRNKLFQPEDMSVKQGTIHCVTKIRTSGMGNMSILNVADRLVFYPRNMVASLSRGTATTI